MGRSRRTIVLAVAVALALVAGGLIAVASAGAATLVCSGRTRHGTCACWHYPRQYWCYPSTTTTTVRATTTTAAPTTTQPATTTTVASGGCLASGVGCLFDDEFNGTTLDLSKWEPDWLSGNNTAITKPVNSEELSCYDPAQVAESGGNLILTAAHRNCTANNGTTYSWASGLVNTEQHFNFTQGTLEARVFIAGGAVPVDWPAVWNGPGTAESDIMEGLEGQACAHYHPGSFVACPSGTWTGWHTFGESVSGNSITYLYDGKAIGTVNVGSEASRYIILNLGISNQDPSLQTPAAMDVDWIRIAS